MEDTLFAIIRMASSIMTVIGIVWCAIHYLVKYKISKMGSDLKDTSIRYSESTNNRIQKVEEQTHSLDVRVTKVEDRLNYIEKV